MLVLSILFSPIIRCTIMLCRFKKSSIPFVPSFGEDYINLVLSGTIKKYHKLESYSSYQTLDSPYYPTIHCTIMLWGSRSHLYPLYYPRWRLHKPGTFRYYQKVPQTGVLLILPNFEHPLYLVARTGSNSLETACGLGAAGLTTSLSYYWQL